MNVGTPKDVAEAASSAGYNKALISGSQFGRLTVLSALAGAYIALGGILSFIVGFGFPEVTAGNPAMQKILSGCVFPIGLILVVVLGAELFTGNNAVLIPALWQRRVTWLDVIGNWTLVYIGNFIGAFLVTYLLVYLCGLTAVEPYHSSIIKVAEAKVSMDWHVVFLKGIGANWCVCLGVWLAMSGHNLVEKMAGSWLPVMAFVALGFEHSIANMFFIPLGMMEGADVGVMESIISSFIPATLGNIVGGALFVGATHAYLYLKRE